MKSLGQGVRQTISYKDIKDEYALSKWEAEKHLWNESKKLGIEVVVIRPPLVYGSGVKGNMLSLIKLI